MGRKAMERENEEDRIYYIYVRKQTVACTCDWLMKAIEQKNARLTVGVAFSEPLVYDQVDRLVLAAINSN
jgi:hypothetical protein